MTQPSTSAAPDGAARDYVRSKYAAPAAAERSGIALCLSGGGYRAVLFHLGGLRRLHELGILSQLSYVSSVSGGSIAAGFLARAIARSPSGAIADFDAEFALPLREFTRRNIRTPAILRRLLPWNWFVSDTGVRAIAERVRSALPSFHLRDLPAKPRFSFCAADMVFGVAWVFERDRMGDYRAGYCAPRDEDDVARAAAASACFPPVFNPLRMKLDPALVTGGDFADPDARLPVRAKLVRGIRLTDGGEYDNLGLEPVWKQAATVLVSDGGEPFLPQARYSLLALLARYSEILSEQVVSLRKRWLLSSFLAGELSGAYWGIGSDVSHFSPDAPGYPDDLGRNVIAHIRTDEDAFADAEAMVLQNHGYALADVSIRIHALELAATKAPFQVPFPEWDWQHLDEVKRALAGSNERRILGRW